MFNAINLVNVTNTGWQPIRMPNTKDGQWVFVNEKYPNEQLAVNANGWVRRKNLVVSPYPWWSTSRWYQIDKRRQAGLDGALIRLLAYIVKNRP